MSNAAGPQVCYLHPDRPAFIQCQRCHRYICPQDMNEASVGFQCGNCVAEGQAAVRQPRTIAGGAISTNVGAITMAIIAINVAAQLVVMFQGGPGQSGLFEWGAMWGWGVAQGQWWRLLTAAFLHGSLMHIAFNMYALYLFGPQAEHLLGRWRFIASYVTVAVGSSVVVYLFEDPQVATIGASGAVFGLFGLSLIYLLRTKQSLNGMLILLAINAVISLQSGISWQGHLGGFITGLVLGVAFGYAPKDKRTLVHLGTFVGLWVLFAIAISWRTENLIGSLVPGLT